MRPLNEKLKGRDIIPKKNSVIMPLDPFIELVVSEGKETIKNLYEYDIEDFISLVEILMVDNYNKKVDYITSLSKMKQG